VNDNVVNGWRWYRSRSGIAVISRGEEDSHAGGASYQDKILPDLPANRRPFTMFSRVASKLEQLSWQLGRATLSKLAKRLAPDQNSAHLEALLLVSDKRERRFLLHRQGDVIETDTVNCGDVRGPFAQGSGARALADHTKLFAGKEIARSQCRLPAACASIPMTGITMRSCRKSRWSLVDSRPQFANDRAFPKTTNANGPRRHLGPFTYPERRTARRRQVHGLDE